MSEQQKKPLQKNMTLDLNIRQVILHVKEQTVIYVTWQRGNDKFIIHIGVKKIKTKSRLINESVSYAAIEEKYQINTIFDVNEDGLPIKDKNVTITFLIL